jgi:hypothetical protein
MDANRQSAVHWMRLLLAVGLCAALTSHVFGQDPQPVGTDEHSSAEPPEAWLNPDWAGDAASSGGEGWLAHKLPHYRARHAGLGEPLRNTSWLNRPVYAGWFIGDRSGGTLARDAFELSPGLFTGAWLGYDLSHYWGSEIRLGLNYGNITYIPSGDADTSSRNPLADFSLLYYPWGDSRLRPYGALGLGIGSFHFSDPLGNPIDHTGLSLPLGLGVKYLCGNRWALRFDVRDNIIFGGGGLNTINSWSVIGGIEYHWGSGASPQYYPW